MDGLVLFWCTFTVLQISSVIGPAGLLPQRDLGLVPPGNLIQFFIVQQWSVVAKAERDGGPVCSTQEPL